MNLKPDCPHFFAAFLIRNQDKLWWLHSVYALLFGAGVMWLGSRNFQFLRVTLLYVLFIWASSLFLPRLLRHPRLSDLWRQRLRWVVGYFHRNFYQQLLFFILPIYYTSATWGARNFLFVGLLALSAVLSTLDIVYERHLSTRWSWNALFFAFNLFAAINVILPVLWSVSNHVAFYASAAFALAGFATFCRRLSGLQGWKMGAAIAIYGLFLALFVMKGRPYVPPAPLRLLKVEFGAAFDREAMRVTAPLSALPSNRTLRVFVLTSIRAPLGLRERVCHQWRLRGKLIYSSPCYQVTGGRSAGFRLWTSQPLPAVPPLATLRLDVITESGQLIGRAWLTAQ